MSDCPRHSVRIIVKVKEEIKDVVDPSGINNICLFVFDEQDYLVGKWAGEANIHDNIYDVSLELEPGKYTFVAWTNEGDTYKCSPASATTDSNTRATYGNMIYFLNCSGNNVFGNDLPDLHHGEYTNAVVEASKDNEFTVYLTPNTYTVNFTVKGLPVLDHRYDFTINDDASSYNFENSIVDDGNDYLHIRSSEFENNELTASFKTLSLAHDRQPIFGLENTTTEKNIYSDDLVDMILKAYEGGGMKVDFSNTFEFDIVLRFDANMGVTITVNGWSYTPNETPIG